MRNRNSKSDIYRGNEKWCSKCMGFHPISLFQERIYSYENKYGKQIISKHFLSRCKSERLIAYNIEKAKQKPFQPLPDYTPNTNLISLSGLKYLLKNGMIKYEQKL